MANPNPKPHRSGRTKAADKRTMKLCGAPKRSGVPCTLEAGWGTDHLGTGRCRHHRNMPDVMETARKMGMPAVTTPQQAITGVLNLAVGNLLYINGRLLELDEEDLFEPKGLMLANWQERLMDRVAKYSATAVNMGVAEAQVRLAEQQTALVGKLLEGVMGDLDLTAAQRKKVGPAIRRQLGTVSVIPEG